MWRAWNQKWIVNVLAVLGMGGVLSMPQAHATSNYSEQEKLIRAPRAVTTLGADLFGDKVNLYTGNLEFTQLDVTLPGNSPLQVSVGRRLVAGRERIQGGLFGQWDLEVPHLHGVFSQLRGWVSPGNTGARCSQFGVPTGVTTSDRASWSGTEYWHGSFLYIPGLGDHELLKRDPSWPVPGGGAHPISTRNHWALRCLSSLNTANGATGEGFIAISPDGTTYRFDWLVSRPMQPLTKSSAAPNSVIQPEPEELEPQRPTPDAAEPEELEPQPPTPDAGSVGGQYQLNRIEVWILPTLVTDRHGNTVTYTYDTTNKWQLKSIEATDASGSPRRITLTYKTPGSTDSNLVATVSDGTRTWTYNYSGLDYWARLQSVVFPDQSRWQLDNISPLLYGINYLGGGDCNNPGTVNPQVLVGSMTHPSGAVGEFTLTPTRHGRAEVQNSCRYDVSVEAYFPDYPNQFDTYALTKKTLSGPGLPGYTWLTAYSAPQPSWAPCSACSASKTVTVTDPEGRHEVHTFGTRFQQTEGQLQQLDMQEASGETIRSTTMRYHEATAPFGQSLQARGDGELASRNLPVNYRKITQQGTDFIWQASQFNEYGLPSIIERSGPLQTRTETIAYRHNTTGWILNRVASVTEGSGKVMVANVYDANVRNLESVSRFGKLQQSMTYYADGTVQTETDGKSQTTTYSSYKRGIPQSIRYHNSQTKSVVVNNIGVITSLTNEAGFATTFGYDAMGRMASVNHPTADTVAWTPTTLSTWQASGGQFDLAAGHWRQQVSTGTARTMTYYDALLRPVYVERWDDSDVAGTLRTLKYGYDSAGRTNFESYPRRTYGQIGPGVYYAYDVLGRQTAKAAKSEVGEADGYAWTRTSYDPGFTTTVKDPRGYTTVYGYQAFDEPSQQTITSILGPERLNVSITRDVFGKPMSVKRGDQTKSVTRRYVYDSAQRLCKTIEPEIGATVLDYDGADNVSWRATGLALPSTTSCDTASVPAASKITYQYDTRNRSTGSTYGDGSAAVAVTLTPDGLLNTVSSNGAVWTNTYNKRRLLERESLVFGGTTYNISRAYDTNGSLQQLTYPDGTVVAYTPNAWGEPRQIGAYANAVAYHPNGGIASFNYGSTTTGIKHSTTQNERGLPLRSLDTGGVRDDQYGYDASGNVTSILDLLPSNVSNRSMTYDGLDRLKTASAPNMWGSATYGYDALDNLTSTTITGGISARNTLHNFNATTNRLDSITNGPPGFNVTYLYDARGNVTQRNSQVFEYDLADRLKRAVGRATYTYDGFKRRVSVVGTDGVTRVQVYAQDGKLLYIAPTGLTPTKYVYLRNHVLVEVSGSTVTYNHTDVLGSPVAQTNTAGAILSRTRYEPYGYIVAGSPRTIGFTGHVNDNDTGLVYMQQRYYDAFAARFLSIDPVVTDANTGGSFNRYAYANNNPYKYVDPDGRNPAAIPAGVGGTFVCGPVCGGIAAGAVLIGGTYAGKKIVNWWNSRSDPKRSDSNEAPKGDGKNDTNSGSSSDNSNPYKGPVTEPVVVVDQHGNAIPVDQGQSVNTSPNGDFQQVVGTDGKPTGDRMDRGGHPRQPDPSAQKPHGHRPGVTRPDGNPHLPIEPKVQ